MTAPPRYDLDRMRAAAERATGLRDPETTGRWEEGARRLCAALSNEAGLGGAGDFALRIMLLDLLASRLRVHAALAANETPRLASPVFVLGLPRTGTTLLHGVLAQHPELTAPSSVECFFPAGHGDDAVRATRRVLDAWQRAVPALYALHAMDVAAPNECGFLLLPGFVTHYFGVVARVPSYLQWLDDLGPLDEEYVALAERYALIAAHRPPHDTRRWVFKCPHHLLALDALARVFPDARFVWTHRDVREAVPSWCSVVATARSRHAAVARNELGPAELALWARGVRRAAAIRPGLAGRVLDVSYRRLVADLPGVFRDVCAFAGVGCDPELLDGVRRWSVAHAKDRHGVHRYTAEDFGLTGSQIERAFDSYAGEPPS